MAVKVIVYEMREGKIHSTKELLTLLDLETWKDLIPPQHMDSARLSIDFPWNQKGTTLVQIYDFKH